MKLNTTLFISLFFSAIIAKATAVGFQKYANESEDNDEIQDEEQESLGSQDLDSQDFDSQDLDSQELDNQESQDLDSQELDNQESQDSQDDQDRKDVFRPSKRLAGILKNLTGNDKEFIDNGQVKETLIKTFSNALNTDVGKDGLEKLNREWQQIFEGSEASRVIGAFGYHVNKIFTLPTDANIINIVTSTISVLLNEAGRGEILNSNMGQILQMAFVLFSSPEMPVIINKAGELVSTAVNKPNAPLMVKQYWDECKKFLQQDDLDNKLNKSFTNLSSMMESLYRQLNTPASTTPTTKRRRNTKQV